ncbi:MFS transporter [Selenomonadales bacterium 4137-cl]|uniref:MFS transporter n=2 Tax=Anaeroselena agilis TaxID=3063788 RepID=A0ABU3P0B5_9FIRM|nr:MFS transporter [Selenomonadales bacterium 4137-cl]
MHFFSAVLIPFYTEWGGLKLSQVLFLNSWFMLWIFLLEVPTGTVADFLGRRASLMAGSLIAAVAALLYVSKPDYHVFLTAEVLFAAAFTLHSGADEALAYDSLKASGLESGAKRTLAAMESFKLGGIVVAAVAGGFIAGHFGYDAPLRFYVLPALAALALACSLKEPPVREAGAPRQGYMTILREGGRFFATNRALLLLTAELAVTSALAWGLIWLYQPLLAAAGLPVAYYGVVHAAACLGQIGFLSNVERLEGVLGSKRRLLTASVTTAGVAYVLLGLTDSLAAVAVLIVAGFTFSLPRVAVFSAYMNRHIPSDKRATVLSATSMCRTLAIVAVNPLIGLLADWSVANTMIILGAGLIAGGLFSRIEDKHLEG